MIDAVRYLVDNGIKWRAMPADFPPWPRVYSFFARWRAAGLVAELHDRLREAVRTVEGRSPEPTAAVVDSQSVKADATVTLASRGYDTGKKINGRKRHLLTDALGLLLAVLVTPASTTDLDTTRVQDPQRRHEARDQARAPPGQPSAQGQGGDGRHQDEHCRGQAVPPQRRSSGGAPRPHPEAVPGRQAAARVLRDAVLLRVASGRGRGHARGRCEAAR
ncbi:transposase [Streptomyces neyagawaensis]|nr:transposase [Streptomyces neyagawaensis]MCL6733263.1 transposase [Streptomyces neyagawaensis]MDE1685065.1 transposase [Streptomyces neyagawaensis]